MVNPTTLLYGSMGCQVSKMRDIKSEIFIAKNQYTKLSKILTFLFKLSCQNHINLYGFFFHLVILLDNKHFDFKRRLGFNLVNFTFLERLLEVIRQNINGWCQQTFCFHKFVDNDQQCFAFTPQANFPTQNLNFHWRWWDRIQAVFLYVFYFILILVP